MKNKSLSMAAISSASNATKRLNPHLFGEVAGQPAQPEAAEKPIIRQSLKPKLNKWEREFRDSFLVTKLNATHISEQDVTFRIGNGVRYTPDFVCVAGSSVSAFEVKGFMRDDAAVKIKVAASKFPWISWYLARRTQDKTWAVQQVFP